MRAAAAPADRVGVKAEGLPAKSFDRHIFIRCQ